MDTTNKVISSVLLLTSIAITAVTPSHQDSLLFIFASPNFVIAAARVMVSYGLFWLSFSEYKPSKQNEKAFLIAGATLVGLGMAAVFATSFGYFLWNYLKILDIMIMMEVGIILMAAAVVPAKAHIYRVKTARAKNPRSKPAQLKLGLRQRTA